jgi:L-rhamnose-H+ transport protein
MTSFLPLLTLVAAGALNASFALPMKFMRKWAWENVWLVWSVFALLILPLSFGFMAIQGFARLSLSPSGPVLRIAAFGALWGLGQVLFGFALEEIGISLSTAIMLGFSTVFGTLVPLFAGRADQSPVLIAAVLFTLVGVILCAKAGRTRDTGQNGTRRGIVFAALAGIGAGLFNFAMAFGGTLMQRAIASGASPIFAQLAAWAPFLMAGAGANVGYCALRLVRRNTFRSFLERDTAAYWCGGLLMAALWLGSALLYGMAVGQMGQFGAVLAWPVYMSLIVIGTAVVGVMAGEWRTAPRRSIVTMIGGLAVLVVAVFVISGIHHRL